MNVELLFTLCCILIIIIIVTIILKDKEIKRVIDLLKDESSDHFLILNDLNNYLDSRLLLLLLFLILTLIFILLLLYK